MTKKPGIVWNYYNKKIDGSQIVAFCKFCNQSYIQNATRMEKHLVRCEKCPETVKETFSKHRTDKGNVQANKAITWVHTKAENNPENEWEETYKVENVACTEDVDMGYEVAEIERESSNGLQSNEDWEAVSGKSPVQPVAQSSTTSASPQERSTTQRKTALRRISQWPLLPTRSIATTHSPLQSKILQEQLLERRILRRVAELELRKKNLELERLQWEYERDKALSDLKLAHESRMMELREEREKQILEQELADV